MTTRRNVLRSIPAAIALAILPSRLTRNVEAAEPRADGFTVYEPFEDGWTENTIPEPFGMAVPTKADQERDIIAYVDRCIEVANWAGGRSHMMHSDGDPGYDHIAIPTPDGELHAHPGDVIFKFGEIVYVAQGIDE